MCNNLLYQTLLNGSCELKRTMANPDDLYLVDELKDVSNLLSNLQGIEDVEQNNRYRHHTAQPLLEMHIYAYQMHGWTYDGESE